MQVQLFDKPEIAAALQKMLGTLEAQWTGGALSDEDYIRVLNNLRFKVGETLFERYNESRRPVAAATSKPEAALRR